uniref:Uncharacterized protein n=1 Tax=Anguilla anguilla TaxID=7936 RepID=A0A0E9QCW6_ANGAN
MSLKAVIYLRSQFQLSFSSFASIHRHFRFTKGNNDWVKHMHEEIEQKNQDTPKAQKTEHGDDEVNRVGKEHQHIDVRHSTVLRVNQVVEELPNGVVDLQGPRKEASEYD